jgi:tetratricopeptide (TPR) repeat protein
MLRKLVLHLNTSLLVAAFYPVQVTGADITPAGNTPRPDSLNITQQLQDAGDLATAEQLRRDALRSAEQIFGPDHKQVAVLLSNLGATLRLEGRYQEAYALSLRALAIAKASGDKRLLAAVLNGLGLALWNEPARAEPVLRRSLALYEQVEGDDPLGIAKIENNLASLYSNEHQYTKALALMTQALALCEKHLGPEDPFLALALGNMFAILMEQHRAGGCHGETSGLCRRARTQQRKSAGIRAYSPNRHRASGTHARSYASRGSPLLGLLLGNFAPHAREDRRQTGGKPRQSDPEGSRPISSNLRAGRLGDGSENRAAMRPNRPADSGTRFSRNRVGPESRRQSAARPSRP